MACSRASFTFSLYTRTLLITLVQYYSYAKITNFPVVAKIVLSFIVRSLLAFNKCCFLLSVFSHLHITLSKYSPIFLIYITFVQVGAVLSAAFSFILSHLPRTVFLCTVPFLIILTRHLLCLTFLSHSQTWRTCFPLPPSPHSSSLPNIVSSPALPCVALLLQPSKWPFKFPLVCCVNKRIQATYFWLIYLFPFQVSAVHPSV